MALLQRYPNHTIVKAPLQLAAKELKGLQIINEFILSIEEKANSSHQSMLLDLHETLHIDVVACVMLAACVHRAKVICGHQVNIRLPRNGSARVALKLFGVAEDEADRIQIPQEIARNVIKVTTGMKGDASPGAKTFEIAQLIENLNPDNALADLVHGALNEATDNVISWAYGSDTEPSEMERWWIAGLSNVKEATFIALDHGQGIPTTAPQNMGDALHGLISGLMKENRFKYINLKPTDVQVLLATIKQKRTGSGLEERGKGLTNMISLIHNFPKGHINIISGDAIYGYRKAEAGNPEDEYCNQLGFAFPGTLIIWHLGALDPKAKS